MESEFIEYTKSEEFKELLESYTQALANEELKFFDADDLLDIAEYFHMQGDIEAACRASDYCLDIYPNHSGAIAFRAHCALFFGDVASAKQLLSNINDSNDIEAVYLQAEIMLHEDNIEEADRYLHSSYEKIKQNSQDRVDMLHDVILLYYEYGLWLQLGSWFEKPEYKYLEENFDTIVAKAQMHTIIGEYDKAILLWNKCIDMDAFNASSWINLAECQFKMGNTHEAMHSSEYALAIAPDYPDAHVVAGNAAYTIGNVPEAISHYLSFLDLLEKDMPESKKYNNIYTAAQCETLLATALFTEMQYDKARIHIDNAIDELEKSHNAIGTGLTYPIEIFQEAYRQAAYIAGAQGEIQGAMNYIQHLNDYDVDQQSIEILKASIYLECNKPQEAFNIINDLMTQSADLILYLKIGAMLVDSCLFEQGYQILEKTISIFNTTDECKIGYDRMAYAAMQLGMYDEFLDALKKSIQYLPTETTTIFSIYFPDDLPLEEYYEYAKNNRITPSSKFQ